MPKYPYSNLILDDGLGRHCLQRYQSRRQQLMTDIDFPVLIPGHQSELSAQNTWITASMPVYQNPEFLYYTGLNQLHAVLLLYPENGRIQERLYLPEKDIKKEFWDGVRLGVGDPDSVAVTQEMTGIQDIRNLETLKEDLLQLCQTVSQLGLPWFVTPKGKLIKNDNAKFRAKLQTWFRQSLFVRLPGGLKLCWRSIFPGKHCQPLLNMRP